MLDARTVEFLTGIYGEGENGDGKGTFGFWKIQRKSFKAIKPVFQTRETVLVIQKLFEIIFWGPRVEPQDSKLFLNNIK